MQIANLQFAFCNLHFAILLRLLAGALILVAAAALPAADAPRAFHSGSRFRKELDSVITISRERAELRPLLRRLAEDRGVSIAIDRRIDPSTRVDVELPPDSLRAAIGAIADESGAQFVIVGDTVFLGPPDATAKLRTLIALREQELDDQGEAALGKRRFELSRRHTLQWADLDRPADLLDRIAELWQLTIEGAELVPHDLWAGATYVGVSASEALSLVLSQFDLTFGWKPGGAGVRIVPAPPTVSIVRSHTPRGLTPAAARDRILEHFPDLQIDIDGRSLTLAATIEKHEDIALLVAGKSLEPRRTRPAQLGSLFRRRITQMKVVRKPAIDVIRSLQANQVPVEYDPAALAAAGINLDQKISFDVQQATIDDLFHAICEPLGLAYEVQAETVVLRPK
jgi:hypothetical protein